MTAHYYVDVYEVLEVLEKITPEERERLTGPTYIYMEKACLVISRAAFRFHVSGLAWSKQMIALLKKRYPEREYAYRRYRMLEDPEPPSILLDD